MSSAEAGALHLLNVVIPRGGDQPGDPRNPVFPLLLSPNLRRALGPGAFRRTKALSLEPLVQGHSLIFPWSGLGVITVWPDALVSATQ